MEREAEIWRNRREQPHPPTPGNPAFSVKELQEAIDERK
jgi:hypothetical protein